MTTTANPKPDFVVEDGCPVNIFPQHWKKLQESGLTAETVRSAGIHSEGDLGKLSAILGWQKVPRTMAPALVFPFTDMDGRNGYTRVRPDNPRALGGKKVKYESPKSQPNKIYLPPGIVPCLSDIGQELIITEGELKALCANQHGFPCIGLVGVEGWHLKGKVRLSPDLERVAWMGRKVFIAFDSDIADKEQIQKSESLLAARLTDLGANVRAVRIPSGGPDASGKPAKVGLDDFIVAHGIGEFRKLLQCAQEPSSPDSIEMKRPASDIDPSREVELMLAGERQDGVPKVRFWKGNFYRYQQGFYCECPMSEVRAKVIQYLDMNYYKLNSSITNNVLDMLKAKSMLSHGIEPPIWLAENVNKWPADEVLATKNCLVHLPSLAEGKAPTMPVTPRLFTLSALDYAFDSEAPTPTTWLDFLRQLWPTVGESDNIDILQEWFGYCLTPDTRQQKILMLIGPKRSGKGTIARVLRELVGRNNATSPTFASLSERFGLQPLIGKNVAIISDARLSGRSDTAVVVERLLSISGEDAQTIDRKNQEAVNTKLQTRFVIISNELPRLGDASGAFTSRIILLRLAESFFGREDQALTDKLLAELPSILLWAIEGWNRLQKFGHFVQPATGAELLEELEGLSSPISVFVRDCCATGPQEKVERGELYAAYKRWAEENGKVHVEDKAGFGRALRANLPMLRDERHRHGDQTHRYYCGIRIRTKI